MNLNKKVKIVILTEMINAKLAMKQTIFEYYIVITAFVLMDFMIKNMNQNANNAIILGINLSIFF